LLRAISGGLGTCHPEKKKAVFLTVGLDGYVGQQLKKLGDVGLANGYRRLYQ
jgi:hypothetical protein